MQFGDPGARTDGERPEESHSGAPGSGACNAAGAAWGAGFVLPEKKRENGDVIVA